MNSVKAYSMNIKDTIQNNINQPRANDHRIGQPDLVNITKVSPQAEKTHSVVASNSISVDISPVWQEAAGKINLKSASADDVANLSSSLFKAGAISFEDHVSLSFQTNPDDDNAKDYIQYWNNQQDKALIQGATREELNDIFRIQSILGYVDSLGG